MVSLSIRSSIPLQLPVEQLPKHPCDSTVSIVGSCVDDSSIDTKSYKETDFCHVLNRVLPDNIRALGWTEVTPEFSARFSASSRTYRYFFVQKNLNIDAMQTAADLLLGKHDFRNFCKMDIVNISNFVREIYDAKINLFVESSYNPTMNVWMLEITGIAFLWHQIRCIMAILLLVGEGNESPDIVSHLLDMEKCPSKPPYPFAEELPLVLHRCNFNQLQIHYQPRTLWALTQHFERVMEKHQIDFARAMNAYEYIKSLSVRQCDIKELVDDLLTKKNRTSRHGKQSNNHNKSNEQTSSSNTTQPVEEVESDEKHSQKRPRANPVTSFDANNKELIGWMDVLASIESQHGVTTFDCNNLHISLRQVKH